jgi:hypothetical protein
MFLLEGLATEALRHGEKKKTYQGQTPLWRRKGEVGKKGVSAFYFELIPISPFFFISLERFILGFGKKCRMPDNPRSLSNQAVKSQ